MKIFQIGFNKCGTRTIHGFFQSNGFRGVHWDRGKLAARMFVNLQNQAPLLEGYDEFDAFSDMELLLKEVLLEGYKLYPQLAAQYPDSLFILNTRNKDAWIRSRLKHGEGSLSKRHMAVFGMASEEALIEHWSKDWDDHHRRVNEFFADRKHKFVLFDIEKTSPAVFQAFVPDRKLDPAHYKVRGKSTADTKNPKTKPLEVNWL